MVYPCEVYDYDILYNAFVFFYLLLSIYEIPCYFWIILILIIAKTSTEIDTYITYKNLFENCVIYLKTCFWNHPKYIFLLNDVSVKRLIALLTTQRFQILLMPRMFHVWDFVEGIFAQKAMSSNLSCQYLYSK